jgi:steroid delta-isomerase-like uncharacterized protein
MPGKNEVVVRRLMDDVWSKGNLKLIDELLTTDYVDNDPVNRTRGLDGVRDVVRKYRSAFPDCKLTIDEMFSVGDRVVVRWHYNGTHQNTLEGIPATGRHVTGPGLSIHRFSGDRIQESYTNWDALGMMQQLGVVTLPGKAFKAGA